MNQNSADVTLSSTETDELTIPKNKFTVEEDVKLLELVEKYNEKNWKKISSHFENKNYIQCFSRFKRIKPGIKRGYWNKEEDEIVLRAYKKYGGKWARIAKEVKSRNGKQVRDRFINVLNPELNRGPFTDSEDIQIAKLYLIHGSKWAKIAKECFTKRSPDLVKNRFYSRIKGNILEKIIKEKELLKNETSTSERKEDTTKDKEKTEETSKEIQVNNSPEPFNTRNDETYTERDNNYPSSFNKNSYNDNNSLSIKLNEISGIVFEDENVNFNMNLFF